MKVYLAGKISGDPDYKAKFARAAEELKSRGYIVLNPAELPDGMTPKDYMSICIPTMLTADAAVFLPDWPTSRGACLEYELCRYIEKPIMMMGEV